MTIRARLNLSLLVAVSLTLAISGWIAVELRHVTLVVQDNLKVNALTRQIILLNSLTYEYLAEPSARKEFQWQATYQTLDRLVHEMEHDPRGVTRIPAHVVGNYARIKETFHQVVAVERRQTNDAQRAQFASLAAQFSDQLLKKNQELYDWVLSASEESNGRLLATMRRDSAAFVLLLGLIALVVGATLYLLKRTLLQSITTLRGGVETISKGNLEHRLPSGSRDEFGQLSGAFNAMTAELQALYQVLEAQHKELLEREQRFRALVEQATDCVLIARADGSLAYASPSMAHLLGYAPATLMNRDLFDYVHPAEVPLARSRFAELLGHSAPLPIRFQVRHQDGSWRIVEGVATNLLAMPAVAGVVINLRDITERRLAEESLRASEEKFSQAFHLSPMIMALSRLADGTLVEVNEQFVNVTGIRREAALGKTSVALGLLTEADRAELTARLASHGRVDNLETKFSVPDGRQIHCLYHGEIILLHGQPHLFSIIQDITVRKQMEDQLRQTQKMEAIGQLAGGVAHDFNNILTAMIMNLNLMQDETGLPPEVQEAIRELENQAQRAADLTRQLLQFSRRQLMQKKALDLNKVVDNLLKMLRRLIGENIRLNFRPWAGPVRIEADAGMMEQVVMNLAVNARDAMPGGGRLLLQIEIVDLPAHPPPAHPEARPGRFACLTVQDSGTGMDGDTLLRIFEPFFTTKEAGKGTGLGLATVFGIIKQHQGWIEVESAPGKGSTFKVLVPAETPAALEAASAIAAPPANGGKETILLAEDELSVRSALCDFLRRKGYHVLEATSGNEAVELWERHRSEISLLLTDMVMPDSLTGMEVGRRAQADRPGLPVIIYTGYSMEIERRGVPQGMTVLYKPVVPATLAAEIRKHLDRPRAQRAADKTNLTGPLSGGD